MRSGTATSGSPPAACLQFTTSPIKHLIWLSLCTSVPWHRLMVTVMPVFHWSYMQRAGARQSCPWSWTAEQAWVCSTLDAAAGVCTLNSNHWKLQLHFHWFDWLLCTVVSLHQWDKTRRDSSYALRGITLTGISCAHPCKDTGTCPYAHTDVQWWWARTD